MAFRSTLREVVRSSCALILCAALLALGAGAQDRVAPAPHAAVSGAQAAPRVAKIEPPEWWIGFYSPVMVLLYGENLEEAQFSVNDRGVAISKVQLEPDGKHAFVWLKLDPAAKSGTVSIHVRTPSGETAAPVVLQQRSSPDGKYQGITPNDVVYLIMPDRFANGDTANDNPPGARAGTFDRSNPRAYHGGDLKGIQEHLPYLKELGVTALWLTPLYENDDSSSDYHGYHAVDEYAVEDHFGTMADLQALVADAHRMGIKILLDKVPNHVGPKHPWATSQPDTGWLHGTPEHHIDNKDYDFPPISDPHAVPANYIEALDGWFVNVLPDLAQENPLVAAYLLQNALWWIESSGVDAFRIDTFPYVPRSFWAYYDKGIFAAYPHFFTMGEVSNEDPTVISYWAGGQTGFDGIDTGLSTPLDFPMYGAIRDVVAKGQSAKKLVDVLRQDRLYPHPELLVTFIDNHDKPRFLTDAGGSLEKLKLAFSLLATTRGIPQLYYGDEVAMAGGDDPDDRRDFPGGFPGDSHNAFTRAGRTPEEQGVYSHVQELLKLRQEHPALRTGIQKHVAVQDRYYAFTREGGGERLLMLFFDDSTAADITLDLAGTSLENAKTLSPILGDSKAELNGSALHLHASPQSLTIFQVQ